MVIIETSVFTRQVSTLIPEDEYRELQSTLVQYPDAGKIIPGSGGLRKLRWTARGKGKRGGARVIYYWAVAQDQLLLLFIYSKNERGDLTLSQLKVLRQIIEEDYP